MPELLDIPKGKVQSTNGKPISSNPTTSSDKHAEHAGLLRLFICVGGIYASFLSWAVLQETITTTEYPVYSETEEGIRVVGSERFTFSVVLNTIQSFLAAVTGFIYLTFSTPRGQKRPPVFPTKRILLPLILVSISSSLASPFGYASLAHIDYLTFVLAKSCKLLPVMFLHVTILRKRYSLSKYAVILLVTIGVATFTLHHPSTSRKRENDSGSNKSSLFGLLLLSINLFLDGLTNTMQDHVFASPKVYGRFTGPQMMVAQNTLSTLLTSTYLLAIPHLSTSILPLLPLPVPPSQTSELSSALSFLSRHPHATKDVLAFAACGAIGQLFIYHTLAHFSSLLLVTVTVTRKMLTMLLSVVWFGHKLRSGQWLGVGLVFGGIGLEGFIQRREKAKKLQEAAKKSSEGKKVR
ncbi:hypothetical protein VTO42DRAFT_78 [Malbranchea cinnamomea]